MIIYAEAVCMDCEDGKIIPLEIAFAISPNEIYILEIPPEKYYRMTINDLYNTRSKMRNKDRFYNSKMWRCPPIEPIEKHKLHESIWWLELRNYIAYTFPGHNELRVRGEFQYHFFKRICRFPYVTKIFMKTGCNVMDIHHNHTSKYINYPCPGIEVRTMAYYNAKKSTH